MRIYHEEQFGPVIPIFFDDIQRRVASKGSAGQSKRQLSRQLAVASGSK
jgi:hypothetical protein